MIIIKANISILDLIWHLWSGIHDFSRLECVSQITEHFAEGEASKLVFEDHPCEALSRDFVQVADVFLLFVSLIFLSNVHRLDLLL